MSSLPIRTTAEDIEVLCDYLTNKPTGVSIKEAKSVLDSKYLDGRKLNAMKFWDLLEEEGDKIRLNEKGRECAKGDNYRKNILLNIIKKIPPYNSIIERAAHRKEDSLSTVDVAAHWHDHFKENVSDSDRVLNDQVVCFFQLAHGAGLGTVHIGRRTKPTRLSFSNEALADYLTNTPIKEGQADEALKVETIQVDDKLENKINEEIVHSKSEKKKLGQAIFVAHGKDKKPLDQLKKILEQFKIPYKIAIDEPNLGRPISGKIREIMEACNCAVLIFTADEKFIDKDGKDIWRPSENVIYELGAAGYLYDNRIVIMKEDSVVFPSNFQDIGYISFEKNSLDAKALDILKELIGFGIVKVST